MGLKNKKKKPSDSAHKDGDRGRSPYFRSRVSHGSKLLPAIDGRSRAARVFRDTYHSMVAHCGGEDELPETMRLMCRRAAAIEAECVNLEARFTLARQKGADPLPGDIDLYQRLTNTLRRVCEALGWQRTARDITPSLGDILSAGHRHA
jgi:hypothetical protein